MMMQLINQPFSACKFPRSARVLKVQCTSGEETNVSSPLAVCGRAGGLVQGLQACGDGDTGGCSLLLQGAARGGVSTNAGGVNIATVVCPLGTQSGTGRTSATRGGGLALWQVSVAFEQKSSAKLFELGRWMRVCLLLLVLLHAPTCECRKHRYGRVAIKVASRSRNAVMVTAPRETVVVDGVIYQRRDELAVSEGSLDGSTLQAVQRSLQRARRRTLAPAPALMETEPYVMLGGLFVATQLFS